MSLDERILHQVGMIGISGGMASGKSTIALSLQKSFNDAFNDETICVIIPFSESLKELSRYVGWDGVKDEKGRRLLQLLGTDVARECINPDYWIHRWTETVVTKYVDRDPAVRAPRLIVIADDVRFENERDFIQQHGGVVLGIVGGPHVDMPVGIENHKSENLNPTVKSNYVIENINMERTVNYLNKIFPELLNRIYPQTHELKIDKVDSSNYVKLATRTESKLDGCDFIRGSDRITRLVHAGLGLCIETGEFQDLIKKTLFYDAAFTQAHIIEELGDVLWYVAIGADALGVSMDEIMKRNIEKLKVRYPEKFTSEKALNRDLKVEGDVLKEEHPRGAHWSCPPTPEPLSKEKEVDPCIGCHMSFSEGCAGCVNYKED